MCKYFDDAMMALILFTYKRCTMYLASFLQKIYITFLFKCQEDAYKKAVVPFSTKNKKKPGYLYPFLNQGVHKYSSVLTSGVGTFRFFIGLLSGQDALLGTHPFMKISKFQKLSLKNAIKF